MKSVFQMSAVAAVAAIGISSSASAGMIVTAGHLPESGYLVGGTIGHTVNEFNSNIHFGQSFTAEVTGPLTGVTLRISHSAGITKNLQVEVYSLDGSGLPATQLAIEEVDPSDVPSGVAVFHTIDFTASSAQIDAGTQYAIVVGVDVGQTSGQPFWGISGFDGNVYPGGNSLQSNNGGNNFFNTSRDWGFEVTVPTPGAASLAGIGMLCAVRRRR